LRLTLLDLADKREFVASLLERISPEFPGRALAEVGHQAPGRRAPAETAVATAG
jgi:hypothetical protein